MAAQANSVALRSPLAASAAALPGRVRIYILIDALGWPIVSSHGFLETELPHRRPLRTTLGYSSGAIPTILTGELPVRHGHWNLLYFDPENSPFRWLRRLEPLSPYLDSRLGRAALTRVGRHLLRLGPSFECLLPPHLMPCFNWVERRSLYRPGGVEGCPTAFDLWQQAGLRFRIYSYRQGADFDLLRRAGRDLLRGHADTVFVYLCELDHFLHTYRQDPAAVRPKLDQYAAAVAELFATARRRDPAAVYRIFSDHGMAPVRSQVDLAAGLRRLRCRMPEDYLAVCDSTMVRCWCFNPEARREIEAWLGTLDCGRLLGEAELRHLGAWFEDGRFGHLIFLLNPGVIVAEGEFNGRGWNPHGMHGYHPDDPDSDAVLLSNQSTDLEVTDIAGIFRFLCEPLAQGAV